jgi:Na+-driven multidrug efflux pump
MNKILGSFSETAVAVYGVYFKLQSFIFMPVFGLNNGMIPIIAYNYGARQKQRIMDTIKLSILFLQNDISHINQKRLISNDTSLF